ncbi:DUF4230 domain-containing protein [Clostridium aestuarii]|uniref:DUF4230 domain-containing protein n=1 Tax=Clostridium aestuarii TaxID=338193 RepID=A0ABT4CY66_9CLOT|nr:DUF4230 domain-containing protein [Clostridium aestuarii]MCY6483050.1 DUF4230 domain-containing protein [Clostridium aestuarii]
MDSELSFNTKKKSFKLGFFHKSIIILVLLIIFLFMLNSVAKIFKLPSITISKKVEINSTVTIEQISKICSLASVKYEYSDVVIKKEPLYINSVKIPFTEKGFLIKFNGKINAGVDVIDFNKTSEDSCTILLSKPKILSNSFDPNSIYYYEKHDGLFNKLEIDEDDKAIANQMKMFEQNKKEDILNKAEQNAKDSLISFMNALSFKNVEIKFSEK